MYSRFIQRLTPCLISYVAIKYKLANPYIWKPLSAIGCSPPQTSQSVLPGIQKVNRFFYPLYFCIAGFWPELRQKGQNTVRLVILIIFVFFPNLNPQVWKEKAFF